MLTLKQVGEEFHVTRQTLMIWLKTGQLKGVKIGRKWLIEDSEIERLKKGERN